VRDVFQGAEADVSGNWAESDSSLIYLRCVSANMEESTCVMHLHDGRTMNDVGPGCLSVEDRSELDNNAKLKQLSLRTKKHVCVHIINNKIVPV
jgi:hypothetical protein